MSANNWAICPQCSANQRTKAADMLAKAALAYGKEPLEGWKEMDRIAREADKPLEKPSWREDWEIGMQDDGTFLVRYDGGCNDCGGSFTYRHEDRFTGYPPA